MPATAAQFHDTHPRAGRFYLRMACACAVIAVAGFTPGYFLPLIRGTESWPAVFHLHGTLLFGWVAFYCWQNWLIAARQTPRHRVWGAFGVCLAAAVVLGSLAVVAVGTQVREVAGFVAEARGFAWVGVSDLLVFGGLIAAAIASVRYPEAHKRLMLMATISLLGPPIGRWVLLGMKALAIVPGAPAGAPPPVAAAYVPHALSFVLVAIAVVRDRRTRGRIHYAYVVGFGAMLLQLVTLQTIAASSAWQGIAGAMAGAVR